jgi:hypothetical protein
MSVRAKMSSLLGLLAGAILSMFGKSPTKATADDFRRADFATSTQRLGVRFTERMRNIFRLAWLKAHKKTDKSHRCHSERSEESHPPHQKSDPALRSP